MDLIISQKVAFVMRCVSSGWADFRVYEVDLEQEKAFHRSESDVRLYGVTSVTDLGPHKYTYNKPILDLGPTVDQ